MRLYTRRGDDGRTDLFGGQRVDKDHLRVEAYGTVDELNSAVGLALAACRHDAVAAPLRVVQERLFELGADLATPRKSDDDLTPIGNVRRIDEGHVTEAEGQIDRACELVPAMRSFVLPGGTELAARLHLARTVCRRAERLCVALARQEPVGTAVTTYLNRLSDLLFALARLANHLDGVSDVPWNPRGG